MKKIIPFMLSVLLLVGCASQSPAPVRTSPEEAKQKKYSAAPPKAPTDKDFYTIPNILQCVPYSREASGIQIFGNAHTWWPQAKAKGYKTSSKPKKGAVMVLSKTKRLRYGHLATVKRVIDKRNIEVAHSNWGGTPKTRKIIYNRMRVVDTSENNDWSSARFWNYPSASYGRVYKVSGFIYPKKDTPKPTIGND